MKSNNKYREFLILFSIGLLIPILSLPHTIALRNILLVCSLIGLYFCKLEWKKYKNKLDFFWIFCIYILLDLIFFSSDIKIAFRNFIGEWFKFILYFILGLGGALFVSGYNHKRIILWMGLLFSAPIILHLFMTFIKWLESPSNQIPFGYLGIQSMHGEIAYTSLSASILLSVYLYFQASKLFEYCYIYLCLLACIVSPVIAKSRGGLIFSVLAIILVAFFAVCIGLRRPAVGAKRSHKAIPIILVGLLAIVFSRSSDVSRWSDIVGKIRMGIYASESGFKISCDGVSALISESNIEQDKNPKTWLQIASVVDGDGMRVLGAITGLKLALENPLGINQSRQAYQVALKNYCHHNPQINPSHSHNGWINAALAIGIPGVILLIYLFYRLIETGCRAIVDNKQPNPCSIALVLFVFIWAIRGLFDATMQDQMLEMQGFTFALLYGLVVVSGRNVIRG